jgi:hypothetical protein
MYVVVRQRRHSLEQAWQRAHPKPSPELEPPSSTPLLAQCSAISSRCHRSHTHPACRAPQVASRNAGKRLRGTRCIARIDAYRRRAQQLRVFILFIFFSGRKFGGCARWSRLSHALPVLRISKYPVLKAVLMQVSEGGISALAWCLVAELLCMTAKNSPWSERVKQHSK